MNTANNEYVIMSFNLLCGENKSNEVYGSPEERKDLVLTHIRNTKPDTIGVQECSTDWYEILSESLEDEYGVVGNVTNYEKLVWRNAIFYRKDRFDLLETRTRWLSETPGVMSRTPFYYQYRVMTFAKLRDKVTQKVFVHCNTHMGFREDERPIHWGALIKMVKSFDVPVLLTGDFNATLDVKECVQLRNEGFPSAIELAPIRNEEDRWIDHCFVTPDTVEVYSHEMLSKMVNGKAASDHRALVVKYRLR